MQQGRLNDILATVRVDVNQNMVQHSVCS